MGAKPMLAKSLKWTFDRTATEIGEFVISEENRVKINLLCRAAIASAYP
jgi:hypothetical protein